MSTRLVRHFWSALPTAHRNTNRQAPSFRSLVGKDQAMLRQRCTAANIRQYCLRRLVFPPASRRISAFWSATLGSDWKSAEVLSIRKALRRIGRDADRVPIDTGRARPGPGPVRHLPAGGGRRTVTPDLRLSQTFIPDLHRDLKACNKDLDDLAEIPVAGGRGSL